MRASRRKAVDFLTGDCRQELNKLGAQGIICIVVIRFRRLRGCRRCVEVDLPYRRDKRHDLNTIDLSQVLFRNCTSGDSTYRRRWWVRRGAIIGAMTRAPMVSRALARPPPLLALTPYFSKYVRSA